MKHVLIDQFIQVMRQTEHSYLELFPIIQEEKEMVQNAQVEGLITVSTSKEHMLDKIRQLDRRRNHLLNQIALTLNMTPENLSLTKLVDYLDPSQGQELKRLRHSLKAILSKVRSANNESRALVHHCLGAIRQSLSILSPQTVTTSVYGATGGLAQGDKGGRLVSNSA